MNVLLPLPIVLPLLTAAASLALTGRHAAQRVLSVTASAATLGASVALLLRVDAEGTLATQIGGWPAPFGITLVADRLSTILLVVAGLLALAVLVYALGQMTEQQERLSFHPVYLVLVAGICASFLTGDLFNL
ncbi:MAG: Na+/H+ antiporter subunit D, partial [Actinophytocola sp.]|nr:Na+/H+ antiporter subunit D [Actinophytocola sp.]